MGGYINFKLGKNFVCRQCNTRYWNV